MFRRTRGDNCLTFSRSLLGYARALLLDYDGTLARFCADPERANYLSWNPRAAEQNPRLLEYSPRAGLGRRAMDAARLLNLKRVEVWGCHGLERLHPNGAYEMPKLEQRTLMAVDLANELLTREGLSELIEHKPAAIAIHWRGLEHEAVNTVKRKVEAVWANLPDKARLCLSAVRRRPGNSSSRKKQRRRGTDDSTRDGQRRSDRLSRR